ncbi:MAG: hypothetical protein SGJ24_12160 [Chloroflexota bacterium]|nr:hypothetical protein [Chloroflexota bacterium]
MNLRIDFTEGLHLLDRLIDSCAFLHDDWTDREGVGGWGQYTTNPLLLSPPVCVTSPLDGYGERTIDHLRSLGAFAGEIIQPTWLTNDLVHNLSQDATALRLLKRVVRSERLHLSTFYNEPERQVEEIAQTLSTREHTVRVYPSRAAFIDSYDKLHFDRFTQDVPTPESALCTDMQALRAFARSARRYPGLVVKLGHRDLFHLDSADGIAGIAHHLVFPLRVETAYPLAASPIVHAVRLNGKSAPLFVIDQYVRDWLHWGNGSPASGTPSQRAQMIDYTLRIGDALGDYEGVYGVDYILTPEGGVYAVDINARFCTSTYPYALLTANGFDPDQVHTRFRLVQCRVDSLDDLTGDPHFIPLRRGTAHGTFLYGPVSYREHDHAVHYVNYVCVGRTAAECNAIDAGLLALIERVSAPNHAG